MPLRSCAALFSDVVVLLPVGGYSPLDWVPEEPADHYLLELGESAAAGEVHVDLLVAVEHELVPGVPAAVVGGAHAVVVVVVAVAHEPEPDEFAAVGE